MDIVQKLRHPDMGWSGDASCVPEDVAEEGAAEIERLRARLESVAQIVEGQPYKEHYRMWPELSKVGNRSNDDEVTKHCAALARVIRVNQQSGSTETK